MVPQAAKGSMYLVGLIDGLWAGFASNGRLMNEDINISLHTMALVRGGRIGAGNVLCQSLLWL